MGPRVKKRSTESQRRAVVEGISRFFAAEGAFRLPWEVNAETREKAEEHDGASGACARGPVATAYERRPGRLLKTPSSLLSVDQCFIPAAAHPVFRSLRSPPHC
eukprot:5332191-Pleurochrysis_carterae.AAC.1